MELFSELYNCYYQVLRRLLCQKESLTIRDISDYIHAEGFEESLLSVVPKIEDGTWNLFQKDGELYLSRLKSDFLTPLSSLQKSYLKALLDDARIGLFFEPQQLRELKHLLADVSPLFKQEQFFYFDRFSDGDPYTEESYRRIFRVLLTAQKKGQYVDIDYNSPTGHRIHHHYIPARLEYSVKNDKFRLFALKDTNRHNPKLEILNLDRIRFAHAVEKFYPCEIDLNKILKSTYYAKPVTLYITDRRNALERAMLHFANYEKNTRRIDDSTYECQIFYNKNMETELLIEVLSFGPVIKVTGNESFLKQLKERLQMQAEINAVLTSPKTVKVNLSQSLSPNT